MSTALKTALVQQALDTSNLYLRNAALKHGVPETAFVPRLWSADKESTSSTVTQSSSTQQTAPAPSALSSGLKTAAIIGLSALSGGSLAGLAISSFLTPQPTVVLPQKDEDRSGLLLPWLEDQGLNQPAQKE